MTSAVTEYAERVVEGDIVAGRLVRLSCERHLRDLNNDRGLRFDDDAAQFALDFFPTVLRLAEGEFAGQPFILQPFQQFIIGSLFGWKGPDGYRRFRTAYIETGKGNGKTPLAAGTGLLGMAADGEPGAEIYAAAVTRDQAKILFSDAEKMAHASPSLSAKFDFTVNNIAYPAMQSFFRAISAEARALDGKRVHMALIDEIHEHPDGMVVDKMRAGTKNRRQALIFEITNSGYDRNSVCYQHHVYSEQVLSGAVQNDEWFAYVCGLDEGDDWTDEAVWPKANPGLDTILPRKYLREQVNEARGMPSKLNIVLRLNFCVWTEQANRWLDMDAWDACTPVQPHDLQAVRAYIDAMETDLRGRECFAGLDMSATTDLTALALWFPPIEPGEPVKVLLRYWLPEETLRAHETRDRVPYSLWARFGFLTPTEGNVVDYDVVRATIRDDVATAYNLRELAIDRWNSTQLQTQLMGDGITVVPFGQGFASMSAPSKELERRVMVRGLDHGGHPVLRYNASNVAVVQDAAGNIKPDKAKSNGRIDGMVATVMAGGRAAFYQGETRSSYEDHGLVFI
ncbi:MAG TPA: terminase TerL endonuclease subunit [Burkholderiales bacterium]|nr:terminase TerL endonuclease subunit [Burkholderiales bacterium]